AHYLHHKFFEVNYGGDGLIPLDRGCGTWHDGSAEGEARMNARFEKKRARMNAKNPAAAAEPRPAPRRPTPPFAKKEPNPRVLGRYAAVQGCGAAPTSMASGICPGRPISGRRKRATRHSRRSEQTQTLNRPEALEVTP